MFANPCFSQGVINRRLTRIRVLLHFVHLDEGSDEHSMHWTAADGAEAMIVRNVS